MHINLYPVALSFRTIVTLLIFINLIHFRFNIMFLATLRITGRLLWQAWRLRRAHDQLGSYGTSNVEQLDRLIKSASNILREDSSMSCGGRKRMSASERRSGSKMWGVVGGWDQNLERRYCGGKWEYGRVVLQVLVYVRRCCAPNEGDWDLLSILVRQSVLTKQRRMTKTSQPMRLISQSYSIFSWRLAHRGRGGKWTHGHQRWCEGAGGEDEASSRVESSLMPGTAPLSASQHCCRVWEAYCPSRLGGWEAARHLPCLHQPRAQGVAEQDHGELISGYGVRERNLRKAAC